MMKQLRATLMRRIYKPGSDGTRPIILKPGRIYILPSRVGMLYASLILSMLMASINYSLSLGYALMFQMLGLALAAMVKTVGNLWGLTVSSSNALPVFAGEMAHFPFVMYNKKNRPRPGLRFQALKNQPRTIKVEADAQVRIDLPVQAEKRGRMSLPRVTLSTPYPLGIFIAWCYPSPNCNCLVYPAPETWPLPVARGETGDGAMAGEAGEEDFAGLRERQQAEPLRHVAWKVAAKDNNERPLLVKHFDGGASAALWLDWSNTASFPASAGVERRLSIMAGWVLLLDQSGFRYGMLLPERRIEPDSGTKHRQQCLEALALFGM